MMAKSISVWWVGALVVGGILWVGQQPSSAADQPGAVRQVLPGSGPAPALSPIPNAAPVYSTAPSAGPANVAPTTTPHSAASPIPESVPPPQGTTATDGAAPASECAEGEECGDVCGALCSPPGKYWLRTDYLAWWTNGTKLPPLVTSSPDGTPVREAGVLGAPGTTILFGGTTVGDDMRSGFHTTLGMWLDCCHKWDVEFDYLSLGERRNDFSMFSTGFPILARPYFDVQHNAQASELVAYPGTLQGTVAADARTYFQGAGVTFSRSLCSCNSCESCESCGSCDGGEQATCGAAACCPPLLFGCRTDLLIGFRYYNLADFVGVTEDLSVTAPGPSQGATFAINDNFRTRNDFYGSEIGLRTQIYRGRWSFEVLTKIAMGNNHQTITINGQTAITPLGGATTVYDAGILAGGTNGGVFQRDQFTVVPQLGLEAGYQVNCHWRTYIGYDLLYWGSVVRAGDQIDLNLDPRNFPPITQTGLPFPQFPGKTDSFWAQGLHLGIERRF
jgi:hypothetical protein